ncbi:MAG: DUF3859 domain-containing protein [Roseiarcus sp.]
MGKGLVWLGAALLVCATPGAAGAETPLPPCPSDTQSVWTDCLGSVAYPNGNRYVGEFRSGQYDGQGTLTFANGESYVGAFHNGAWSGQGVYTFANGERYAGQFADGKWNGPGVYFYPNGERWVGPFRDGRRDGPGVLYDASGAIKQAAAAPPPAAAAAPVATQADDGAAERIDVVDFGLYATRTQRVVAAPTTASGDQKIVSGERLQAKTRAVPARLGVEFGLRFRIVGRSGAVVTVRKVTRFPAPGLTNPATGKTLTEDVYVSPHRVGPLAYEGYRFENAWELVPGIWTIELWVGERKLASESFQVVGR